MAPFRACQKGELPGPLPLLVDGEKCKRMQQKFCLTLELVNYELFRVTTLAMSTRPFNRQ